MLFSTAWVYDPNYVPESDEKTTIDTHNYWIHRMTPKIRSGDQRPTYFIAAGRCGKENET